MKRRIVILTQGKTNPTEAKTAVGVIRYGQDDVVGVLDAGEAGKTTNDLLGCGGDTPIVAALGDVEADTLLIGIAPAGGRLPPDWRAIVLEAARRGMRIVSGLHTFLADDEEIRRTADAHGAEIHDVRRPKRGIEVGRNVAWSTPCFRVHTVGHDCSVGKMLVALEITKALTDRGRRAKFIATGQTGIMIAGDGVPIDAVVSDFVAGAIEELVLRHQDEEFLVVEGQGSLFHPYYSGVTLGLLHGCAAHALVMCLDASRKTIHRTDVPLPPVEQVIDIYERITRPLFPARVVAVAVNTSRLPEAAAAEAVQRAQETTGLPTSDPIRYGIGPIRDAILAYEAEWKRTR